MANSRRGREALRGAEVEVFDVIFEVLPSQQWAELLRAPLERAAAKGNRVLAQRLVGAGAEIGDALHEAVEGGHGDIANDLLKNGASTATKNMEGYTPLHVAACNGQAEMIQLLVLNVADTDVFDSIRERTPLCLAVSQGHVVATLAMLAAGADVNRRNCEDKIPALSVAAGNGHAEILRAVIEHGADVDAVDDERYTALHIAAYSDSAEAIDVLVGAGANIEARNSEGSTPLHVASATLSPQALLCLVTHGANVNAQDDGLQTPLIRATAMYAGTVEGTAEVVDSLLRAGADETIVDEDGKKAADMIEEDVEEENRLTEVERVRELLANAPADRAWRRRGYLILCRAYPDRVQQQNQVISGAHHADQAQRTRSCAKLARGEASGGYQAAGGSKVHELEGGDCAGVMAKVLRLQEEGIFRKIAGYL